MSDEDPNIIGTWHEAELFAAGHMVGLGFEDALVTPPGADGGVDVIATGGRAQVKHFASAPVGAPAVQQLVGASSMAEHGLFYSLSGYTAAAVRLAEERDIALFHYSISGDIAPITSSARSLVEDGFAVWATGFETVAREEFILALQRYGQTVFDAAIAVVERAADGAKLLYNEQRARGEDELARSTIRRTLREMKAIHAMGSDANGIHDVTIHLFVKDALRVEALAHQLAERVGLDFEQLSLDARDARWKARAHDAGRPRPAH
jgi:hypothetical protein